MMQFYIPEVKAVEEVNCVCVCVCVCACVYMCIMS